MTLNSVAAAKMEAKGKASFQIKDRTIVLRTNEGVEFKWHCRTPKEADDQLRLFRASLKYEKAA